MIPHAARDHPSRAEACGGSDGLDAREREPPSETARGTSSRCCKPRFSVLAGGRGWRRSSCSADRHGLLVLYSPFSHHLRPPRDVTELALVLGVANLGTRQQLQCNVPIAIPTSHPASHLMAPPLQTSPEAATGSARLPTYFPFRLSPRWGLRLKPRSRPDQLLGTVPCDDISTRSLQAALLHLLQIRASGNKMLGAALAMVVNARELASWGLHA